MDITQDGIAQEEQIVDAEIVSSDDTSESPTNMQSESDQSTVLTSLDELIKSHIASLDRLKEEKKKLQEMVADGLNNDVNFKELSDKAKEATKAKSQARQQIMNRPGVIEFVNKLKNIASEIKEKNMSLSDYLLEYQKMAGVNQVEGYDGEVREIVQLARLVKKFSKDK
jgi:hypothetical protein